MSCICKQCLSDGTETMLESKKPEQPARPEPSAAQALGDAAAAWFRFWFGMPPREQQDE